MSQLWNLLRRRPAPHVAAGWRQFHRFETSAEVRTALEQRQPVVALESTIITHGMPHPVNYQTAVKVQDAVRAQGAVPATIAILRGRIHVGLTDEQLLELAAMEVPCVKTSRRDFPYVLSQKLNGGTTVSGTMLVASRAGIPIFVTGGVGGVHRGAETDMDISADLTELGRTPVAVVSSGVKSILDIEKTLEYLETQGVCVATLGPERHFPAFFTAASGFQSPYHVRTVAEAAGLVRQCCDLAATGSGLLIAVPIPASHQADGDAVERAVERALADARRRGVKGRDVTPDVLDAVNRLTRGASLRANVALIENNAAVGAAIAVELSRLRRADRRRDAADSSSSTGRAATTPPPNRSGASGIKPAVVVGGSIVDSVVTLYEDSIQTDASTHRGRIRQSYGGVGRNLADGLTRLGGRPLFLTAVGDDRQADDLIRHNAHMESRGVLRLKGAATATYVALLDRRGDFLFGVGDMDIHQHLDVDWVKRHEEEIAECSLLIMDGNTPTPTMSYVLDVCNQARVPVFYEPTDINKAAKPFECAGSAAVAYASPNLAELLRMLPAAAAAGVATPQQLPLDALVGSIDVACRPLLERMHCLLVTLGQRGLLVVRRGSPYDPLPLAPWTSAQLCDQTVSSTYYPAPSVERVVSVSGAGDCLAAGFIAGLLKGWPQDECVQLALRSAQCSLRSTPAVPEALAGVATPRRR